MNIKKNDVVVIKIEDIGSEGEGIGKLDGFPLFVKDAVAGDEAEVKIIKLKKNYGYGRLMKVLKKSPFRVDPKCPIASQCGGCQLQALDYKEQLRYKENKVRNHLQRIGKFDSLEILPIIGMENPYFYRNKAQFPVGLDKDGNIITGFYAGRTHSIIDTRKCYIGVEVNEEILDRVIRYMEEEKIKPYGEETGKGLVRHILIRYGFTTKEIMVCLIINSEMLPGKEKLIKSLREIPGMTSISINVNREKTNVILGKEVKLLWGKERITDYIGDIQYQISPLSFFQVNPVQTKVLYEQALSFAGLTGKEVVWDLYCGIGTISLFLARNAKQVYGVEIVPEAIADARENARLNRIENIEFYVGKAEEVLPEKYEKEDIRADVIVVDPPRKGCDESLLDTIVKMEPERVVYVSCDSATLARDLRYLCDRGFRVEKVQPVDQFGQTVHVESIILMTYCGLENKK